MLKYPESSFNWSRVSAYCSNCTLYFGGVWFIKLVTVLHLHVTQFINVHISLVEQKIKEGQWAIQIMSPLRLLHTSHSYTSKDLYLFLWTLVLHWIYSSVQLRHSSFENNNDKQNLYSKSTAHCIDWTKYCHYPTTHLHI